MTELFAAIERRSIWQDVAGQVRKMIEDGTLGAGQKLPSERDMCQQFGVSRISVREALRALEREGFIEVQAGRGAFVRAHFDRERHVLETLIGFNRESAEKVFELRMLFEPNLAGLAARSISSENLERLRETVERMRNHVENPEAAIEADSDFHRVLGESTGNPLVESLVRFVMTATGSERLITLNTRKGVERALLGHERILECVAAGDEDRATAAMKEHLQDAVAFARRF
ncbi:regulatory protein, gntR family [Ensifer adhaerens]|nr:regulatory protein, gntR family [Ensifer adhaerens]